MSTNSPDLTPMVDMDRMSTVLTRLEMSTNLANESLPKAPSDYETPVSRYIGKPVNCGHEANIARVSMDISRREGTDVKVYVRCTTVGDGGLDDKQWYEMTGELTNAAVPVETDGFMQVRYYYEKPVGFTDFQIKLVLTGNQLKTKYPMVKKLKQFALYDEEKDTTIGGVGETYSATEGASEEETSGEG